MVVFLAFVNLPPHAACIFHVIFTRSVLGETAGGPWCVKLESELQPSLTVYAGSAEDEKYDSDKENSSHAGGFRSPPDCDARFLKMGKGDNNKQVLRAVIQHANQNIVQPIQQIKKGMYASWL